MSIQQIFTEYGLCTRNCAKNVRYISGENKEPFLHKAFVQLEQAINNNQNRYMIINRYAISSVQFSRSVMSNSLQPHESQHARPPCPSPTPGSHSNSCPSSQWCHPAISSSAVPFFSCPQSLPASESFPMSQLFEWGGQSIGVSASASVLPMNTQDWSRTLSEIISAMKQYNKARGHQVGWVAISQKMTRKRFLKKGWCMAKDIKKAKK